MFRWSSLIFYTEKLLVFILSNSLRKIGRNDEKKKNQVECKKCRKIHTLIDFVSNIYIWMSSLTVIYAITSNFYLCVIKWNRNVAYIYHVSFPTASNVICLIWNSLAKMLAIILITMGIVWLTEHGMKRKKIQQIFTSCDKQ